MKLTLVGKSRPIWAHWRWQLFLGPVRRRWKHRQRRPVKAIPDAEAIEIARIEAQVGRLEIAASIGSINAAGQLAAMAEDRVGIARRRLAQDALDRLQKSPFPKAIRI